MFRTSSYSAAVVLSIMVFLCLGGGRAVAQEGSTSAHQPVIVLTGIYAPPKDQIAQRLAATITQSLGLVMRLTGHLTVRRADFLAPTFSLARARGYYQREGADGAVYGSVSPTQNGDYRIELELWNASHPDSPPKLFRRTISNVLTSFSLADELSVTVASTIVGRKLAEGSLVVANTSFLPSYSVYADGQLLGRNRSGFHLLTGKREIVVARPGGPLGDVPLQVFHVDIKEGQTATVTLSKPAARKTAATTAAGQPNGAGPQAAQSAHANTPPSPGSAPRTNGTSSSSTVASATEAPPTPGSKGSGAPSVSSRSPGALAVVRVKAAGHLTVDGKADGAVFPGKPRRIGDLALGRHTVTVRYRDGFVDRSDAIFSSGTLGFNVNFSHMPMSFEQRRLFHAASLSFEDKQYPLRRPAQYLSALDSLSRIEPPDAVRQSEIDHARALVKTWRGQRLAHIGWLAGFWTSFGLLAFNPNSSNTLSTSQVIETVTLFGSLVGLIANAYHRGTTVGAVTGDINSIQAGYNLVPQAVVPSGSRLRPHASPKIYAATPSGLAVSTDGGASWTTYAKSSGLAGASLSGIFVSGEKIFAATAGGLAVSDDSGVSWRTYTTADGIGSDIVYGVFAAGTDIYAATAHGLSVSKNNGSSWVTYTTRSGLGSNQVYGVYAAGSTIYAATGRGLAISNDQGATWATYTAGHGLRSSVVSQVYRAGSTIYAATWGGLSISRDGGASWKTYTTRNGLGSNQVFGVSVSNSTIYAATDDGLSVSADSGRTWKTYRASDGLGSNVVNGVYAVGSDVFAATRAGVSISFDGGASWSNAATGEGLASNVVTAVTAR